jgi:HK97 family phage major capsid protein
MADPAASTSQPDVIAAAISYLIAAGYNPSFITLNPADWLATTLLKADTAGTYLLSGAVQSAVRPQLWGLPVVQSPSIAAGTFLVGDGNCAVLLDREQATIEMSREDRDNFIKNLITILAERRVILTVPLPAGFATGNLAAP